MTERSSPTEVAGGEETSRVDRRPRVLVVDVDPALAELLDEWLVAGGCDVIVDVGKATSESGTFDFILVDVPFPRQGSPGTLSRVMNAHPATPIVALSSTFFANVDGHGAIARALGVSGVLPKPVARDALLAVIHRLSNSPQ